MSLSTSLTLHHSLSRPSISLRFTLSLFYIFPLDWLPCEIVHDTQYVCVCVCTCMPLCAQFLHECAQIAKCMYVHFSVACVCLRACMSACVRVRWLSSWHPLGRESIPAGSWWFSICRPAYVREQTRPGWLTSQVSWLTGWMAKLLTDWPTDSVISCLIYWLIKTPWLKWLTTCLISDGYKCQDLTLRYQFPWTST